MRLNALYLYSVNNTLGFPGGSVSKQSACNVGDLLPFSPEAQESSLQARWCHLLHPFMGVELRPSGPRDHSCPQAAHKWLCFVPEMSRGVSIL